MSMSSPETGSRSMAASRSSWKASATASCRSVCRVTSSVEATLRMGMLPRKSGPLVGDELADHGQGHLDAVAQARAGGHPRDVDPPLADGARHLGADPGD